MANDALFQALAQAKAQPDRWARAVDTGAQAGQNIIGGYMKGKEINQQLEQYKLLSTPLGQMYSDPSQIPFGLSPQHTVKDLITLAPAMENYVPSSLIGGAARSFGANVTDGSSQPPVNPAPLGGTSSPTPPPGTTDLAAIQGTGAGAQDNIPPGTPPAVVGGGQPMINVPAGGMGMKGFQNIVLPALKAGQEERHFGITQGNENERARLSREQQERNFQEAQQNEKNRTMAGETAKIAPSLTEAGTIQDDINALVPLYKGYQPIPFAGTALAHLTARSGSSSFGTPTMQAGKQIEQITPALSAKVNYLLNKRFNSGEAAMLQAQVVPNASDDEANAKQKIANLQRLTAVMQGGDINALQMVASSIAGRPVNPSLPSSGGQPQPRGQGQAPPNSTTGDPEADAAIQRIQSSGLNPQAKQARIMAVKARMGHAR